MRDISVRVTRQTARKILGIVGKYPVVSLLAIGLATTYIAGFVLRVLPSSVPDVFLFPFGAFCLVTTGAIVTRLAVVPALLRGHRWFHLRLRESVQTRRSARRTHARILVGGLLNLAYFTILYFASYQAVLKSIFPMAGIMEGIIPSGYSEVMAQTWPIFLVILFAGSLGPATLYAITWLRQYGGSASEPIREPRETLLTVLQLVCYLSCLFLVLCFFTQGATQLMYFERTYLMFVLPGTIANLAVLQWIERTSRP